MSSELLASKIIVEEEEPAVRTIAPVATAVLCIAGVTERGPYGRTLISSAEEYQNIYGGYTTNGKVKQALDGYFTNGGIQAYVKRVVHYADPAVPTPATAAAATLTLQTAAGAPYAGEITGTDTGPTWEITPAGTLKVTIDGVGPDTVTFDAAAASVTGSNTQPFALTDGWTMTFNVNGNAKSVTFNTAEFVAIGAATAAEVAAVINGEVTEVQATVSAGAVVITTDKLGTGATINTFADGVGTPVATLGFTAASDTGTGDCADSTAMTFSEVKTLIEADVNAAGPTCTVTQESGGEITITSNSPGASSSVQIDATSTLDTVFGFDNATHQGGTGAAVATLQVDGKTDGAYGNGIEIIIAAATSGDSDEFNLSVQEDGVIVEVWPNLSMTDSDDNFVETVINDATTGSNLITVTDLDAAPPSPLDLPATGTFGPMTGGNDGLTSLADTDFIGAEAGETGFRGFDDVLDGTLLICPDRPTAAVHNAMLAYCETTRDKQMFAILDSPASSDAAAIITYVETTAALLNASEFGAIYWPQVKCLNPNTTIFGTDTDITVPPSGHIAGVYARTDGSQDGGVYQPPAGIERGQLLGITGFETDEVLKMAKRDLVYPKRINPLTVFPGAPRHIDGTRTLKGNGNFPSVAERRGVIFIEQSVKNGLQFARHSNNNEELRARVDRSVTAFLLIQMNNGAFRTKDPATAFFVDFGEGLNTTAVQFAGKLIGRIGLATNKPTDWVILRFSQDTRALEEEIAAATT